MFAKLRGDGEQKQPQVYLYIFYILFLFFSLYPAKQKMTHFCRNCSHSYWRFSRNFYFRLCVIGHGITIILRPSYQLPNKSIMIVIGYRINFLLSIQRLHASFRLHIGSSVYVLGGRRPAVEIIILTSAFE